MLKIKFSLFLSGGGSVIGVAKVMLPFFVKFDFEESDIKIIGDEKLKSFLKLQIEEMAKDIIREKVFVHANENYLGQVCLN